MIREAATVMLVRDDPTLEVFMLRRTPRAVFGPGAYVFPGGAVDATDHLVPVAGRENHVADQLMGRDGALRWWAAAAREAFEESGFLLADADVVSAFSQYRAGLNAGEHRFDDLLHKHGTAIAGHEMLLFSHWLTPEGSPRRYDTWFLLARAPEGQFGEHDNAETVDSQWVQPSEMLDRWSRDEIELIFPTMRTLRVMEQFDTATDLLDAVRHAEADALVNNTTPLLVDDASGERIALRGDDLGVARRGWRQLHSAWEQDVEAEQRDRMARGGSVA